MCYTAGEVNNMRTPEQVQEILRCLAQAYPADCSLQYQKDYELLFAVRLAAQCTDERVNQVTPALYARFPTLEAFAAAEPEDVEPYVHSCGFYRAKARDIVLCARKLAAEYGGRVPDTMTSAATRLAQCFCRIISYEMHISPRTASDSRTVWDSWTG